MPSSRRMKGGGREDRAVPLDARAPSASAPRARSARCARAPAPIAFDRVRRVVERELDAPVRELFGDFDEEPFAIASLGQVHRARTDDGAQVAVKVQHPDVAEAIEADLRNLGLVGPILKRLAPGARRRCSPGRGARADLRRARLRDRGPAPAPPGAPPPRPSAHPCGACAHRPLRRADCSSSSTSEGLGPQEIARPSRGRARPCGRARLPLLLRPGLARPDRRRGPACRQLPAVRRRSRVLAGLRPAARRSSPPYVEGERAVMRAIAEGDAQGVHDGLSAPRLPARAGRRRSRGAARAPRAAGEWMLAPGFRRLDPEDVDRIVELGYPPRSPWFAQMRRLSLPAPALLLRRMELQVLSVLGRPARGRRLGRAGRRAPCRRARVDGPRPRGP